jgi:hypothetical protein
VESIPELGMTFVFMNEIHIRCALPNGPSICMDVGDRIVELDVDEAEKLVEMLKAAIVDANRHLGEMDKFAGALVRETDG